MYDDFFLNYTFLNWVLFRHRRVILQKKCKEVRAVSQFKRLLIVNMLWYTCIYHLGMCVFYSHTCGPHIYFYILEHRHDNCRPRDVPRVIQNFHCWSPCTDHQRKPDTEQVEGYPARTMIRNINNAACPDQLLQSRGNCKAMKRQV
jgi:hypothetical protein